MRNKRPNQFRDALSADMTPRECEICHDTKRIHPDRIVCWECRGRLNEEFNEAVKQMQAEYREKGQWFWL